MPSQDPLPATWPNSLALPLVIRKLEVTVDQQGAPARCRRQLTIEREMVDCRPFRVYISNAVEQSYAHGLPRLARVLRPPAGKRGSLLGAARQSIYSTPHLLG
jgi:hypothetical protein